MAEIDCNNTLMQWYCSVHRVKLIIIAVTCVTYKSLLHRLFLLKTCFLSIILFQVQ